MEQRERVRSTRSRDRVIYHVTESGIDAFEDWLRSDVHKEPVRMDVLARLAVSQPQHAPLLVEALNSYERECLDMIACTAAHAPHERDAWVRLMASGLRDQALRHVEAELTWIKSMRRRIEEFGDAQPG